MVAPFPFYMRGNSAIPAAIGTEDGKEWIEFGAKLAIADSAPIG